MSDWIERERGWARRLTRQALRRMVKYCTYNGPSCLKYLRSIGYSDDQLFFVPYYYDEGNVCHEPRTLRTDTCKRLVISGRVHHRQRSAIVGQQLKNWCTHHPDQSVELIVCGEGPALGEFGILSNVCRVDLRGHCSDAQLRQAYHDADVMAFPRSPTNGG